ncbi:hypothetical protein [Halorarius litoreus]|uniref:hypothetical protein n=1 Tax=Halorarius litoreus TaxID=2962676 RepID=UPI0020CE49CA|nr:hypothetical protein [Halorarius litoreus]
MSLISRSTLHFVGVFLGMCVVMAGTMGFLAFHDTDWNYNYDHNEGDTYPRTAGTVEYYEQLSPEKQRIVDRAMAGERFTFETEEPVPPAVVKRNGSYHIFNRFTSFDFFDPGTGVPALLSLGGVALVAVSARADLRH